MFASILLGLIAALPPQPPQGASAASVAYRLDLEYLASDELAGRGCGTPEDAATVRYLARRMADLGLEPALEEGQFVQRFSVPDIRPRDYESDATRLEYVAGDAERVVALGREAVPFAGTLDNPIQIALIYPSADTSDFWARNYLALTKRLEQLGIAFETTEFASRQIEHSLQSTYANQVEQDADLYDYVIFGPSELAIQADNISKLAANDGFATYVWAFHTPLKYLENQPDAWFDFSSAAGALTMCDYMISRLGEGVTMSMNRGIPGITDNQRSGDFKACVEEKAGRLGHRV